MGVRNRNSDRPLLGLSVENHRVKCDICSFLVEANNYLVDVCSQLVLIYAPLLGSFHRVNKHQTIKEEEEEEEQEEEEQEKEEQEEEEQEDQQIEIEGETRSSSSPSQSLSKIFYEAYDVQCHVDGCALSVAYHTNTTGSDVQSNGRNHR